MKNKIFKKITLLFLLVLVSACTNASAEDINDSSKNGDYILTTTKGVVTMFDNVSNVVSEIDLGGGPDSDYIYTMDAGNVYSSQLSTIDTMPNILYAVDKTTRKMTMVLTYKNNLKTLRSTILKEGDINDIYGYNGMFYYSTLNPKTKAKPYTYVRPQIITKDGKLSYATNVPVNTNKVSTFIYAENLVEEYLQYTGLDKKLSAIDLELMNIPKVDKEAYEIPSDVNLWLANNKTIYFFGDTQMGEYNIETNQITFHYGSIRPLAANYIDGINKNIYTISDFGENSTKTILLNIDYDKMNVNKAIEINYANALALHVDKNKNIYVLFKNQYSSKNFGQLRIFRYNDYSEQYTVGVNYLPTKILSRNDMVYLFNPFEDYFLIGAAGSSEFTNVSKGNDSNKKYTNIFLVNESYTNDYEYDENGRMVNRNNIFIDADGNMIDENNDRINIYGQRINENGQAINKNGELIDKYNNVINEKGEIIKYVPDKNGYYYNSKGQYVSETGILLVRNEIGDWILPEELIKEEGIVITGHYDEFGNFIIDDEILEKYPDAYEIWQQQKNKK